MNIKIRQWNTYFNELWQKHRFWIIVLAIALLFDTLSTIYFMTKQGIHFEIHPLVKYSALLLGPIVGTILSAFCFKIVVSIFLAMYLWRWRLWVLITPAVTSTFAGFFNLFGNKFF